MFVCFCVFFFFCFCCLCCWCFFFLFCFFFSHWLACFPTSSGHIPCFRQFIIQYFQHTDNCGTRNNTPGPVGIWTHLITSLIYNITRKPVLEITLWTSHVMTFFLWHKQHKNSYIHRVIEYRCTSLDHAARYAYISLIDIIYHSDMCVILHMCCDL